MTTTIKVQDSPRKGSLSHNQCGKGDIQLRLRTISGHLNGVEKMVEESAYCLDILRQITAVQSALSQVALILMSSHMSHCVKSAIQRGDGDEEIKELVDILKCMKHL
jgi:DNA-binding FrmR family transcriptional regulator